LSRWRCRQSAQAWPAVAATGLVAVALCPVNRVVDKLDGAINPGLKSPDLNSRLGRLGAGWKIRMVAGFCNKTLKRAAIVISSGGKLG